MKIPSFMNIFRMFFGLVLILKTEGFVLFFAKNRELGLECSSVHGDGS